MQSYRVGVGLVVVAGMLWSLMGLAIRNVEAASTWQILLYRSLGMVAVLLGFIIWRSGGHPIRQIRRAGLAGVIGGLGLVVAFAGAIFAIQATTIANAVFLFAASPFLTAILAFVLLREHVRPATWVAIGIAVLGIIVMVREGLSIGAADGNIAALLSSLGFAAFTVTLRWGKLEDMMPAVLLGGLFSIIAALIVIDLQGDTLAIGLHDILISLAMGALLLANGMVLYTLGSRVIPAAEATLLSMVEVLLAPVWVWLFLNETASLATFVGGGIVLLAIIVNALSGARRSATA